MDASRLRVALLEQPARTSNKYETWVSMPDAHITVISDRGGWGADDTVVCEVARVPLLGRAQAWTLAPAWLKGLASVDKDVDLVASHELYSVTTHQARRFARHRGVPHVVHISETMATNPLYRVPPYSRITRQSVRHVDWFVCTTERARHHAVDLGCDEARTSVVHSGVDTTRFTPRTEGLVAEPVVLFVGMLRANRGADKGVRELVDACARLAPSHPGLRLILVGEGHLRPELEARAATTSFLEVRGRVPRAQIPELMRDARVLVLASKTTWKWEEQFGYVLAEAMASGLPVVGARSGSIPEVVPAWNPLVPEGDTSRLAEGIAAALGPDGDARGVRNRAWAEVNLDLGRQAGAGLRDVLGGVVQTPRQLPGR